jgi:hypothetical protein
MVVRFGGRKEMKAMNFVRFMQVNKTGKKTGELYHFA